MLILTQPLNYGGRLYAIGEDVQGKLPLELIEQLQENGHLQELKPPENDTATLDPDSGNGDGGQKPAPDDPPDDGKPGRRRNG